MRPLVFCPLVISLLALGAIASADPPKPTAGAATPVKAATAPKPIRRITRPKYALAKADKVAVVKAVNAGAASYAKDNDAKKFLSFGNGLRGDALAAYESTAFGIIAARAVEPAQRNQMSAHYSIESGRVLGISRNASTCMFTADIEVVLKNTGAAVPSNVEPKLEAPLYFSTYRASLPRLGGGGTATVTLPTIALPSDRNSSGSCSENSFKMYFTFTGVASFAMYVLEVGLDGDATVTAVTPDSNEGSGGNGNGPDLPPCTGLKKCPDGSCVPITLGCSVY